MTHSRAQLLAHLAEHHHWAPPRSPRGRPRGTRAELDYVHTRLHTDGTDLVRHLSETNKETNMTADLPAIPTPDLKVDLNRPLSPVEGANLRAHAMEYQVDDRFTRPVPRFLCELPWVGSNDVITDRIASMLLTSPDPDRMPDEDGTISFQKLVRHTVEVFDIAVAAGDKEGGWAGYLLMDVTVDDQPEHIVANTGAKEAVMRLAIAWARDEFPLRGRVVEKPLKNASGNKPIMFLAEKDFFAPDQGQQVGAS